MSPFDGRPVLTASAMRAAEAASGHSTDSLMTRAGAAIAEQVRRLAMGAEVLIACGPGNNGGDGYVAATILRTAGVPVRVAASADPATEAARRSQGGVVRPGRSPARGGALAGVRRCPVRHRPVSPVG